jgi:hypothetical protein
MVNLTSRKNNIRSASFFYSLPYLCRLKRGSLEVQIPLQRTLVIRIMVALEFKYKIKKKTDFSDH